MKWFDTHAHYDDEKFDSENREELLKQLFSENICGITGAAVNLKTSLNQISMAERFSCFYAAVGIHPENISDEQDGLQQTMDRLRNLLKHPKVVAIGEIGLDYYWAENPPREVQKEWFEAQLGLAAETGYPVIVHDREAHGDVFEILCRYPTVTGIIHSCSMHAEMVKELVKRGWYISFSGVITYKNAVKPCEAIRVVPDDRILIETDCPYLAPVPMRGKCNRSDYVEYTARKAAELRGVDLENFSKITIANARRVFRISELGMEKKLV
jgi:TatD DNase family protein